MRYFKLFFCLLSHEKDVTEKCGISRSGVKAIMKSFHSEVASFIHVCNGGFPWISKKNYQPFHRPSPRDDFFISENETFRKFQWQWKVTCSHKQNNRKIFPSFGVFFIHHNWTELDCYKPRVNILVAWQNAGRLKVYDFKKLWNFKKICEMLGIRGMLVPIWLLRIKYFRDTMKPSVVGNIE